MQNSTAMTSRRRRGEKGRESAGDESGKIKLGGSIIRCFYRSLEHLAFTRRRDCPIGGNNSKKKKEKKKEKGIDQDIGGGSFVLPFAKSASPPRRVPERRSGRPEDADIARRFRGIGIAWEQLPVLSLQGRKQGEQKAPIIPRVPRGTEKMSRRRRSLTCCAPAMTAPADRCYRCHEEGAEGRFNAPADSKFGITV